MLFRERIILGVGLLWVLRILILPWCRYYHRAFWRHLRPLEFWNPSRAANSRIIKRIWTRLVWDLLETVWKRERSALVHKLAIREAEKKRKANASTLGAFGACVCTIRRLR